MLILCSVALSDTELLASRRYEVVLTFATYYNPLAAEFFFFYCYPSGGTEIILCTPSPGTEFFFHAYCKARAFFFDTRVFRAEN